MRASDTWTLGYMRESSRIGHHLKVKEKFRRDCSNPCGFCKLTLDDEEGDPVTIRL